jgi:transcriptional regulator with XRE-family HTH domain
MGSIGSAPYRLQPFCAWEAFRVTRKGVAGFDGQRLRAFRTELGLNGTELAHLAEIPPRDVSKYENGKMAPGPDRLARLAAAVHVANLDLVYREILGHGLVSLRAAAGLTQEALAELAGPDMTVSRLKSLELGKVRRLTHADAGSLATALNVTPEEVRAAHEWDLDQVGQ